MNTSKAPVPTLKVGAPPTIELPGSSTRREKAEAQLLAEAKTMEQVQQVIKGKRSPMSKA